MPSHTAGELLISRSFKSRTALFTKSWHFCMAYAANLHLALVFFFPNLLGASPISTRLDGRHLPRRITLMQGDAGILFPLLLKKTLLVKCRAWAATGWLVKLMLTYTRNIKFPCWTSPFFPHFVFDSRTGVVHKTACSLLSYIVVPG